MPSDTRTENLKLAGLSGAALLMEALFLRMHSLYFLKNHAIAFMELALAAGIVYLIALYVFDHIPASRAASILLILGALVFRATLWPMLPTISDDLQRYRWDGKVQAEGWSPYALAPQDPKLAYLRDHEYEIMPGRETASIYPPASQLLYRLTWKLFPGPIAFKVPFAAADVGVLLLLLGLFRDKKDRLFRVAVYAWNPLIIVEFAGSGHNDVLGLLGIVAGLWLIRSRPAIASVPIAIAAMAKVFPAVLLPVWIRGAGWPEKRKGWIAGGLALLTGILLVAPYWNAMGTLRHNLTYYEATWKNYNASLYTLLDWFTGGGTRFPALFGAAAMWGFALWLAWKRAGAARATYLLMGTCLAFWPNGYSWYFTWIVPLLCFFPNPAWLMLTVLQFLSYNVLIGYGILGIFQFDLKMQWLVYAPFYGLLIAQFFWTLCQPNNPSKFKAPTSQNPVA